MSDGNMIQRAFTRLALDAEAKGAVGFFFILLLVLSWLGLAPPDRPSDAEREHTERCAVLPVTDPALRDDLLTQRWVWVDETHIRRPGCESTP